MHKSVPSDVIFFSKFGSLQEVVLDPVCNKRLDPDLALDLVCYKSFDSDPVCYKRLEPDPVGWTPLTACRISSAVQTSAQNGSHQKTSPFSNHQQSSAGIDGQSPAYDPSSCN